MQHNAALTLPGDNHFNSIRQFANILGAQVLGTHWYWVCGVFYW
jgi:hypothetical protein